MTTFKPIIYPISNRSEIKLIKLMGNDMTLTIQKKRINEYLVTKHWSNGRMQVTSCDELTMMNAYRTFILEYAGIQKEMLDIA